MIIKSNPQPSKTPYSQLLSLIILAAALTLLLAGCGAPIETTPEPTNVNVQLKWLHQAQFAGFYVAQAQGLYAQEGLAVNFLEGGPGIDIAERVLSGEADFGVIAPEKLLHYLTRNRNKSAMKRVMFLTELLGLKWTPGHDRLMGEIGTGLSLLDPSAQARGKVLHKYGLKINVDPDLLKDRILGRSKRTAL